MFIDIILPIPHYTNSSYIGVVDAIYNTYTVPISVYLFLRVFDL